MSSDTGYFQRSFIAGVVTPSVSTRRDTERLQFGLTRCQNFQVMRHGPVANRPGSMYVEPTWDAIPSFSSVFQLEGFRFNDDDAYVLLLAYPGGADATSYLTVYRDGAAYELQGAIAPYSLLLAYVPGDVVTGSDAKHYIALCDVPIGVDPVVNPLTGLWSELAAGVTNGVLALPFRYLIPGAMSASQAGDVVTFTGAGQTIELVRGGSNNWTLLPPAYKPSMQQPMNIIQVAAGGTGGGIQRRYKVTAVMAESFIESLPGADDSGGIGVIAGAAFTSPQYLTEDIEVAHVAHGRATGDEIAITAAYPTSAFSAYQSAVIALSGTVWKITVPDTVGMPGVPDPDRFTLDDSVAMFDRDPAVGSVSAPDPYPELTIEYGLAYREFLNAQANAGHKFSWDPVDDAVEYLIYRSDDDQQYGFVDSVAIASYDEEPLLIRAIDQSLPPPTYGRPFSEGDQPRSSGYYQQRRVFAGSGADPQRIRLSRTGDFNNFSTRLPVKDDDAMLVDIAAEEANLIRNIVAAGQLLVIFSSGAVWSLGGDLDGVVKPTQPPSLLPLSYEGSSSLKPVRVDDRVLYVESRNTFIRELQFSLRDGSTTGYAGRDLSIWASHLFRGHTIADWTYARVPDNTLWVVRSDGAMLGFTYIPEHDIWAWHEHSTGGDDDKYISVAAIPEGNVDVVYMVVERLVNGTTKNYVEAMTPRKSGDEPGYDQRRDALFLDSYLTYDGTNVDEVTVLTLTHAGMPTWLAGDTGYTLTATSGTPFPGDASNVDIGYRLVDEDGSEVECIVTTDGSTTIQTVTLLTDCPSGLRGIASTTAWVRMTHTVSGLGHLEGRTVGVLADAVVLPQETVSSAALAQFSRPYGIIHVGIPIVAEFETLDLDFLSRGDSVADKKKTVNAVSLHMRNSRGVTAGPDSSEQSGFEIAWDDGEDSATLVSATRPVRIEARPSRAGHVVVQQLQPVPCEILGITVSAKIHGR